MCSCRPTIGTFGPQGQMLVAKLLQQKSRVDCSAVQFPSSDKNMFLGMRSDARRRLVKSKNASHRYIFRASDHLPESVDWRRKGAVAPIKDQGSCGSRWVFSTVTAVEGINQIPTGEMITLSGQELVDCDKCIMMVAMKNAKVFNIDDYEDVPPNEKSLQKAVAHQPICVAIEASGRAFQHYSSGIFSGRCGTQLDHGVAVVGYGTEKWSRLLDSEELMGLQLGQSRVISLSHGCSAKCGIAMEASYPIKNARNKIIAGEEGIINSV
ncbi:hypothetical protein T459_11677 [Capsicum annuum]|uniref:Peptidase C1A papain C-terminal domain-containing protein n=1 Tax=Capsicum annuum TaxID=4072 RepID=A0A2G2ZMU9_CAPAN|nr:hypothetical protein T459_11677 [Capsicum annuum]